jgi:peptide/nickel transport system substrate-binding protein
MSAAGAVGVVIASCAPATSAPSTTEATATSAAPVQAAATPTAIPTQSATATPVPTLASAKYNEAPILADLVKSGKLPPVEERLPKNPLVLSPIDSIGKYGGRIRSFSSDLGTHWEESQYGNSPLRWIDDGLGIAPGHVETWETNADNTEWTLHMREGLKWSDGEPCTFDDVMFWWEDLIGSDLGDQPPDFGTAGGKLATFTKVDDLTLKITYVEPSPLTAKRLAMWVNGSIGPRWIAAKHYLKQFHPKYNTAVKDFADMKQKVLFKTNPDCPSLDPWICTKYEIAQTITWDRNPYYYAVDTEGNQLPYIDGIDDQQVKDREVQLLQIMQGSVDFEHFADVTLGDVATLKENEAKGNYTTLLWDSGSGTGQMYFWNYDAKDEKKRELYRNPKFKQAMSFALDRPTIQKIVYYNTGVQTTGTMSPKAIEFNFNEEAQQRYQKYRDAYVAYDPEKAKALLDEVGVKAGADGLRTYPDGSKFEVRIDIQADAGKEANSVLEIATKNWKDVGLNIVVNQVPPADFKTKWTAGELEFRTNWEVGDGPDHLLYPSWLVPNEPERWAPLGGNMLTLQGTDKEETECDKNPWDRQPPRYCKADKDYAGTPVAKLHEIYEKAKVEVDELKRHKMVWDMLEIHYENLFYMGTVANYPRIIIASKNLTNVPKKEQLKLGGFVNPWIIPYPAITNPETYSFTNV